MRSRRDEGFTLVELIMAIAIMSVVGLTVVGVVYAVARSGISQQNRLNQDNQVMLASTFFAQDMANVDNVAGGGLAFPSAIPCGTLAGYYPFVLMIPSVVASPATASTVQAVFYAQNGSSTTVGTTLVRGECRGSSATLSSDTLVTNTLLTTMTSSTVSTALSCYNAAVTTSSTCSPATTVAVGFAGSLTKPWQAGTTTTSFNLFGVRRTT